MHLEDRAGRSGVGDQMRRDRLAAGLTQEELADRSGLSVRAISNMERGLTARPRRSTLRHIAAALRQATEGHADLSLPAWLPRPAQLPADLADFTGRTEQLDQLTAAAGPGQPGGAVAVCVVAGAGGIGKTVLAVHAAHLLAPAYPDGQLYLNLHGASEQPLTPANALARILRDLGTDPAAMPAEEAERAARFRSLAAGRQLLIVLDDARDAAQVRPLLPGSDSCTVIITSRSSLQDLESARLLRLEALTSADATALFARIVGARRAQREPAAVRAVLTACGGLPLAIRIAAARLAARPAWTVAALAERLEDEHRRLNELATGDLAVRASFLVSYAQARASGAGDGHPADRVFRVLALAPGPDVSLPAAAALLGQPADRVEPALELLVDMHLLQSVAPGRYRFHDLLRAYASERVADEEDQPARDAAVWRLLSWYLHTAAAAARAINPHRTQVQPGPAPAGLTPLTFGCSDEALAWLEAEHFCLVPAVSQAARLGEHEIAWQLPVLLWELFSRRGHGSDWVGTHRTGLASARLLRDRNAEQWVLTHLGGAYVFTGQMQAAIGCLRQCVGIQRELGQRESEVRTLYNLGMSLAEVGQCELAIEPVRQALQYFREAGNRYNEAIALSGMGGIMRRQERHAEAIGHYQEALDILRALEQKGYEAAVLTELSMARLGLGQADAAVLDAATAAELCRQAGSQRDEGNALAVLGQAYRDLGDIDRARQHWLAAQEILARLGHPRAAEVAGWLTELDPARPAAALRR
ncbi:MAG TPA: tetratricopeptide repeat protein [Streptosporangiaceae bacterium]|jgi:tetratricopeptide (TPR) repeat protein/transcriptional regulator with XRE-family HTH domain